MGTRGSSAGDIWQLIWDSKEEVRSILRRRNVGGKFDIGRYFSRFMLDNCKNVIILKGCNSVEDGGGMFR